MRRFAPPKEKKNKKEIALLPARWGEGAWVASLQLTAHMREEEITPP